MNPRAAAAAMTAFVLTSCSAPQPAPTSSAATPSEEYAQAILASAVRSPDWSVPLRPLGDGPVQTVSTFTTYDLDTKNHYVWVSLPAQLWELCHGKQDAILGIQQILGLPPQPDDPQRPLHIILFQVKQDSLFRPCPGGMDPSTPPDAPRCLSADTLNPNLDQTTTRFLLRQFWTAHHVTFTSGGHPQFGYPWTAMGWTYDWDPEAKTHVGASEFVIKQGTVVDKHTVRTLTPAEFCHAPAPPMDGVAERTVSSATASTPRSVLAPD